jgi:hypothetical protein
LLANNKRTQAIDRSIDGLKKILQKFWEEKKSLRAEEEEEEEEVRLLRDLTRHSFVLLERKKERKALRRSRFFSLGFPVSSGGY